MKDDTKLYTNRAQTYIKLGKYAEALVDCDWALRVSISIFILSMPQPPYNTIAGIQNKSTVS